MQYYLAVDIGASSGRHILGHVENGKICLEEIYRFENKLEDKGGSLCWNIPKLFAHILAGLKECKKLEKVPVSMAIDTWGVDFVLLDGNNQMLGDATAYRDKRTEGMEAVVSAAISEEELYKKTGIQRQSFNTIYQLAALRENAPDMLKKAESLLMIPDYFGFMLTGVKKQEYTNATTGGLVNAQSGEWDVDILAALKLPQKLFCPLSQPGTVLGGLTAEVQTEVGFNCKVLLAATHDTASAFMAVPARDDNAVYISSGTWSLLGMENEKPITGEKGRLANFTNEGGYAHKYRFLKNIMGLWIIQSVSRNLDKRYTYTQLENMAKDSEGFGAVIDVNHKAFLAPLNMIDAIKAYCEGHNQPVPQTVGEIMQCVYQSLALSYADAVADLRMLTGKTFTSVNIVGGGSKDGYLNELTAKATGLTVFAGPSEGTALGNITAQLLYAGEYQGLQEARNAIKQSFEIKEIKP